MNQGKNISILGSTGSLGRQTLDIVKRNRDRFKVMALSANTNVDLLAKQAIEFGAGVVAIMDKSLYKELKSLVDGHDIKAYAGPEGINEVATIEGADIVVNNLVGSVGLLPTLAAIDAGRTVGLANKETLVVAGEIVMSAARDKGVQIIPIDSEHSAIFQCIRDERRYLKKIILTASGGPFVDSTEQELERATPNHALKHPNWDMGNKITIDSATMMNKGFEVIEAHYLFNMPLAAIDVVVHRQSIIHSMVEFVDGSILAHLGVPDMRIPIQYALTYPQRVSSPAKALDITDIGSITFEKPPKSISYCLDLAYEAIAQKGTMPSVLNASNEVAVDRFLKGEINFLHIGRIIEHVMSKHSNNRCPSLDDILAADKWARTVARGY